MSAMIEMVNGVASFAENGRKERAWHGLGNDQQIFDRPMFVKEALEACHANYGVKLAPVVALSDELVHAMENGEFIIQPGVAGTAVNTKETIKALKAYLAKAWEQKDVEIAAVIEETEPES